MIKLTLEEYEEKVDQVATYILQDFRMFIKDAVSEAINSTFKIEFIEEEEKK